MIDKTFASAAEAVADIASRWQTELAGVVAATEIGAAEDRARRSLADNGYGTSAVRIESGRYEANATLAPEARFRAADTPANAVRIDLSTTARTYFARALGLPAEVGIRARGTAARAQFAAFHVGSGLAALDGGIANAVLGALLAQDLAMFVVFFAIDPIKQLLGVS